MYVLPADLERAEPITSMLLGAGLDPWEKNDEGKTAMEFLIAEGKDEVADLLEVLAGAPPAPG